MLGFICRDSWLWQTIGLIFYATTASIVFICIPACFIFLISNLSSNYRQKNRLWVDIFKDFFSTLFKMIKLFLIYYSIYVLTTGETDLTYIDDFLSWFE